MHTYLNILFVHSRRDDKSFCSLSLSLAFSFPQEDPFKVKPSVFNSQPQGLPTDPFQSEDPFKTDPFKGCHPP